MCLSENDIGPCYLSPSQREKHCYNIKTGKSYQKRIPVHELKKNLKEAGIIKTVGNWQKLAKQAQNLNIPTHYAKESIKPGWVNKPKGAHQILFERGWINPTKSCPYTEHGCIPMTLPPLLTLIHNHLILITLSKKQS